MTDERRRAQSIPDDAALPIRGLTSDPMRSRLVYLFVGWLSAAGLGKAGDWEPIAPAPALLTLPPQAAPDKGPLMRVAATTTRRDRPDRPTELPNIDSRLDIKPLVEPKKEPMRTMPLRDRLFGPDYDNSLLFLPDRNPGLRQPPCPCLPLGDWWVNAAYFIGQTQSDTIPALITSDTSTLYGDERLQQPFRSGMRLEIGSWLDRCHNWGIDGSFFFMQSTLATFSVGSTGETVVARPYVLQPGDIAGADVVAGPGVGSGFVSVRSPMTFIGSDVNCRHTLACEDRWRLDFLSGYRFVRLSEQIDIFSHSDYSNGTSRNVNDSFRTVNNFHGGQIGFAGEYRYERLYLSGFAKIAFGATWDVLTVDGTTQTAAGQSSPGGLLTSPSMLGSTHSRQFGVVPETNVTLGYQLFDHWRAYIGYTFLFVSSVARPGQALDVNLSMGSLPKPDIHTQFWMHGINMGMEVRY